MICLRCICAHKYKKGTKILIDKIIQYVASSSPKKIVFLSTIFVLVGSVPMVYGFSYIFGEPYSKFLLYVSIVLPLILTPMTVFLLIRLTSHLAHVKKYLDEEMEKSKEKDIILFEQARFVLMGEMMANISHQWKQPLNTINLALLNMKLSNLNIENKNYDIIEDNVKYLASTIDDFISFFDKRSHSEMKTLHSVVKEIHNIIDAHIANKKIDLEIVIDNGYGDVYIASSISQVVLNLINNAKDALENTEIKKIRVQFLVNEYGLEIECCDTGSGVDESIKDKIFTPYFTTKEKTQGTGIGLYMSKEIIYKIFDGEINISSRSLSRSTLYPSSNLEKTCFFIAIPYSKNCYMKEKNHDT